MALSGWQNGVSWAMVEGNRLRHAQPPFVGAPLC